MQHELRLKTAMAPVSDDVIARQPSMTGALILCQTLSGLDDKQLVGQKGIVKDAAQWSRIKGGQHHFPQDKLDAYMDLCGNETPLLWLARRRGYELRPLETEVERKLRLQQEQNAELERENAILRGLLKGRGDDTPRNGPCGAAVEGHRRSALFRVGDAVVHAISTYPGAADRIPDCCDGKRGGAGMTTLDDKATEFEELDRDLALKMRRPTGPEACGYCLNCELPLFGGARWCDDDCRDDWQARVGGGVVR